MRGQLKENVIKVDLTCGTINPDSKRSPPASSILRNTRLSRSHLHGDVLKSDIGSCCPGSGINAGQAVFFAIGVPVAGRPTHHKVRIATIVVVTRSTGACINPVTCPVVVVGDAILDQTVRGPAVEVECTAVACLREVVVPGIVSHGDILCIEDPHAEARGSVVNESAIAVHSRPLNDDISHSRKNNTAARHRIHIRVARTVVEGAVRHHNIVQEVVTVVPVSPGLEASKSEAADVHLVEIEVLPGHVEIRIEVKEDTTDNLAI